MYIPAHNTSFICSPTIITYRAKISILVGCIHIPVTVAIPTTKLNVSVLAKKNQVQICFSLICLTLLLLHMELKLLGHRHLSDRWVIPAPLGHHTCGKFINREKEIITDLTATH